MSTTKVIRVPVRRKFLVVGFDEGDFPRAWGAADVLEDAIERASQEASAYIENRFALDGGRVELRLRVLDGDKPSRDLQTTIRHGESVEFRRYSSDVLDPRD